MSVQKETTAAGDATKDTQEKDSEIVSVCSTVWSGPTTDYITYLSIYDDSIIVTAGVEPVAPSWDTMEARKRGIQQSVTHTLDVVQPDKLFVYDHEIDTAGLVLGRLPPHHRETVSSTPLSFINTNRQYEKMLQGLAEFSSRQAPWTHKGNLSEPIKNHAYIYTDGSYVPENGSTAVGYVITDTRGQIYEFGSKPLENPTERSLAAEFEAIKYGIQRAKNRRGVKTITVFSDSMDAVRALNCLGQKQALPNETTQYPWEIGLEASTFRTVGVSYVNREENTLADALAKKGQSSQYRLLSP